MNKRGERVLDKMLMELQNNMRACGILITFSGRFSQGIIEELGDAIKKHMEAEDRSRNIIFNVFGVYIEQTHNIKKYTVEKEDSCFYNQIVNSGIITIGKNENGYFIWSGNLIENVDAQALAARINQLIKLDKNELKKQYKEQIKKELPPDSKGAGVGLISIARKASLPVEYSILELDENLSFFSIKVTV